MRAHETVDALLALDSLDCADAVERFWATFMDPEWELEDLAEVKRLVAEPRVVRRESGLVSLEDATLVPGDLNVTGDVDVHGHTVVLGDVTCTGYLYSSIHTCLIVTGAVKAKAINALRSYWLG